MQALAPRLGRAALPLLLVVPTTAGCFGSETVYADRADVSLPRATATTKTSPLDIPADATFLLRIGEDGTLAQAGTAKVTVDTARLHDGVLETVTGNPALGETAAIDFPTFLLTERYPRAIVRVVNAGRVDQLSPGKAEFRFGADFMIDKHSAGAAVDNGDNLLQRGLSSDPTMFKLEIDRDRPTCLVRGLEGAVIVRTADFIQPGWWYRAECHRTDESVTLTLTEFAPDGSVTTTATTTKGRTGPVVMAEPQIPLSIGGKLARNGGPIESATDQFNGRAAHAYLVIAR